MTIRELYDSIGGNYDQAVKVMKSEKLIDRYVRKLKNSGVGEKLAAAGGTMDPVQLFECSHSMKGVCANLGLDELAAAAEVITEEFRPGSTRKMSDDEVRGKLNAIDALYKRAIDGIAVYEAQSGK